MNKALQVGSTMLQSTAAKLKKKSELARPLQVSTGALVISMAIGKMEIRVC